MEDERYAFMRAENDDRVALHRFFSEYGGDFIPPGQLIALEDTAAWEGYLWNPAGDRVSVVVDQETRELVGHLSLHFTRTLCEHYATFEWLLVHPEHRRKRIARRLFESQIICARMYLCHVAYVICAPDSPAIGLVRSLGFSRTEGSDRHWELQL